MINLFQQGAFTIPEGSTPDMLRAKRERLAALMPRYGQAKYVGEGIGQLFSGIQQGRQTRKMDAYEADRRKSAEDMFNSRGPLSVLGMSQPAGPNQDIADEAMTALGLPSSIVQSESGGNWNALNSEGYGGRGQFGAERLADAARAGVIPAGMTGEAYSRAPRETQLAVEEWHKRDIMGNLGQYVGVDVDGPGPIPPLTEDSLLAVAHLGGTGGARRFVESGGQYNPADSNGTSLADYATRHAGGGQGSTMSAQGRQSGGADVAYLTQLAANPWLSQEQRAVVMSELQQAQQANDPMRQLDMQLKQAQIQKAQNDAAGIGGANGVRSSKILADGTLVQSTDSGPRVFSNTGQELTGQEAADAIREANAYDVENQREIYGGRRTGTLEADVDLGGAAASAAEAGKIAAEAGKVSFEAYGTTMKSLSTINEAIDAIDGGAASGLTQKYLPNITLASASLENAMNRMGLDVIGSVTFGALSEGEMRLAMDTAVPRDLSPPELREWLIRKRDAQEKAAQALYQAGLYLSKPGNTLESWMQQNPPQLSGGTPPPAGGASPPVAGGGGDNSNDPLGLR